jgi:hypothetical protein
MPLNVDALRKEIADQAPLHDKTSIPTPVDSNDSVPVQQVKEHIKRGIARDTTNEANTTTTTATSQTSNDTTSSNITSSRHDTITSTTQSGK